MKDYAILLYYHYTSIEDPESFRDSHHEFCIKCNLLGRIIISEEGINGTVSGKVKDCENYMEALRNDNRFQEIDFKVDYAEEHAFRRLNVRYKKEIVHSELLDVNPIQKTGKHLEPDEFRKLKNSDNVVILDVRSNYEHAVGRFKNAVTLDIPHFRYFKEKVDELKHLKDKKVITYCTGGIKCEKASAYLLEKGFKDVYQLHGGIIKYGMEAGGEDFEGKCYVFDERITVDVNKVNPKIISQCSVTGKPTERMVNCANPHCNKHLPMSEEGALFTNGCCSKKCQHHPDTRSYNGTGNYKRKMNGYNPWKHSKRIPSPLT